MDLWNTCIVSEDTHRRRNTLPKSKLETKVSNPTLPRVYNTVQRQGHGVSPRGKGVRVRLAGTTGPSQPPFGVAPRGRLVWRHRHASEPERELTPSNDDPPPTGQGRIKGDYRTDSETGGP